MADLSQGARPPDDTRPRLRDLFRQRPKVKYLAKCAFCGLVEGQPDHDYCGHPAVYYVRENEQDAPPPDPQFLVGR